MSDTGGRAICRSCGRKSRATIRRGGRVSLWNLAVGWSIAPYPADFAHPDGSTGDIFRCPACNKRLMATAT